MEDMRRIRVMHRLSDENQGMCKFVKVVNFLAIVDKVVDILNCCKVKN